MLGGVNQIELSSHPVWTKRVKQLERLLDNPLAIKDLERRARISFGWTRTMTQNVLAMGENKQVYFTNGKWRRP